MEHLKYFLESNGGSRIIDRTNDYVIHFITSFEGMENMDINDPYWCTTNIKSFNDYVSWKYCFLRIKFNSGLKIRITIDHRNGPYSAAFGGYMTLSDGKPHRVYPTERRNIDYVLSPKSLEYTYSGDELNEAVNKEIEKIDFHNLNRIIKRIVERKWFGFVNKK